MPECWMCGKDCEKLSFDGLCNKCVTTTDDTIEAFIDTVHKTQHYADVIDTLAASGD